MWNELLKNKEFLKKTEEFLKNPEIIDIIVFGSGVKGKERPQDVDLLILLSPHAKNKVEREYEVRKSLEKIIRNISVTTKTYEEMLNPAFFAREAILAEGISLRQRKHFAAGLGYIPLMLFKYTLKKMNKSKRMQFYYSLLGRNKEEGMLKKTKSYKFSETIVLAPPESAETIKAFLEKWDITYNEFPILIPERIHTYKISRQK